MNKHYLKIYPEHYNNVVSKTKTFEIRNNDRAFQKGDTVIMNCVSREGIGHDSMERIKFKIGDVYPIDEEKVVFSILEMELIR